MENHKPVSKYYPVHLDQLKKLFFYLDNFMWNKHNKLNERRSTKYSAPNNYKYIWYRSIWLINGSQLLANSADIDFSRTLLWHK